MHCRPACHAAQLRELALVIRVPNAGAKDVAVLISNDLSEQNIYEFYHAFQERVKLVTGAVPCVCVCVAWERAPHICAD